MYIRKTRKSHKGKTYTNYLLVESVSDPQGPSPAHHLLARQPGARALRTVAGFGPPPRSQLAGADLSSCCRPAKSRLWPRKVRRARGVRTKQADAPPVACPTLAVDSGAGRPWKRPARRVHVHVGHQMWQQLGLNEILAGAGLPHRACQLTEVMTLNRLIFPLSEHAMPDWIRAHGAWAIFWERDFSTLNDEALYRNLDRLHPNREGHRTGTGGTGEDAVQPGRHLVSLRSDLDLLRGRSLGQPAGEARLLTRQAAGLPSRCWSGWCWTGTGFPKRTKSSRATARIAPRSRRCWTPWRSVWGEKPGATVVVDRGMAYEEDLAADSGARAPLPGGGPAAGAERLAGGLREQRSDWEEVIRTPSPRNPGQEKSPVQIKRRQKGTRSTSSA